MDDPLFVIKLQMTKTLAKKKEKKENWMKSTLQKNCQFTVMASRHFLSLYGKDKADNHIHKGLSINHVGIFAPPPPSWSLLLNKPYVIKWKFGSPPPLNCPRGLW